MAKERMNLVCVKLEEEEIEKKKGLMRRGSRSSATMRGPVKKWGGFFDYFTIILGSQQGGEVGERRPKGTPNWG